MEENEYHQKAKKKLKLHRQPINWPNSNDKRMSRHKEISKVDFK